MLEKIHGPVMHSIFIRVAFRSEPRDKDVAGLLQRSTRRRANKKSACVKRHLTWLKGKWSSFRRKKAISVGANGTSQQPKVQEWKLSWGSQGSRRVLNPNRARLWWPFERAPKR